MVLDCIAGGFFSKFIGGESIANCVKAGHAAARLCVQQSGCVLPTVSTKSPIKLLGMGNPLLDISAEVPQEVFDK